MSYEMLRGWCATAQPCPNVGLVGAVLLPPIRVCPMCATQYFSVLASACNTGGEYVVGSTDTSLGCRTMDDDEMKTGQRREGILLSVNAVFQVMALVPTNSMQQVVPK